MTFPAEASILAILAAVPAPGVPLHRAYSDKERALLGLFATLAPDEKAAFQARLAGDTPQDSMCLAFRSLATERRARLLAALEPKETRHGR